MRADAHHVWNWRGPRSVSYERLSGLPFREFCAQRIFQPLGMGSTHFHDDHRRVVKNRAYSYNPTAAGTFQNFVLSYANAGGTSLFTTVEDLAQWDLNFYDGKVGGQAVIDLMHTRGVLNDGTAIPYAFGLSLGQYRGLRTVEHGGSDAGFRSMLMRFPDQHFTVALAGNVSDLDTAKLAHQVADICLADRFDRLQPSAARAVSPPVEIAVDSTHPSNKAGVYYCAETAETLLLEERDGKLVIPSGPGLELLPVAPERFQLVVAPEIEFQFETSALGQRQVRQLAGTNKPIIYTAMAPAQLTPDQLAEYAGRFYSPELDVSLYIRMQQGQLLLHHRKYGDAIMRPTFNDAFKCDFSDDMGAPSSMDLMFYRDAGVIAGFRLSSGRIRHLHYIKIDRAIS
jgi:Beta-lactamase